MPAPTGFSDSARATRVMSGSISRTWSRAAQSKDCSVVRSGQPCSWIVAMTPSTSASRSGVFAGSSTLVSMFQRISS